MKKIILLFVSIFGFAIISFGQSNQTKPQTADQSKSEAVKYFAQGIQKSVHLTDSQTIEVQKVYEKGLTPNEADSTNVYNAMYKNGETPSVEYIKYVFQISLRLQPKFMPILTEDQKEALNRQFSNARAMLHL